MRELITSPTNSRVKHWVALQKDRIYRRKMGRVLVEGKNLVMDLVALGKVVALITLTETSLPVAEHFLVSERVLRKIATVEHSDGWLAEVEISQIPLPQHVTSLCVLEQLQDPGNVGTLLRTAWALGWEGVYLLTPCCDPLNPKAIRAAKGATFFLPILEGDWDQLERVIEENGLVPLAADTQGIDLDILEKPKRTALLIGREAQGISSQARERFSRITIPMRGPAESLNAAIAGAIFLYQLRPKADYV